MEEEKKHLRIKKETHIRVKALAYSQGLQIDEMVNILVDVYERVNRNELVI